MEIDGNRIKTLIWGIPPAPLDRIILPVAGMPNIRDHLARLGVILLRFADVDQVAGLFIVQVQSPMSVPQRSAVSDQPPPG